MTTRRVFQRFLFLVVAVGSLKQTEMQGQATTPAQRLDELAAATSLEREGLKPWRLRVTFTVKSPDGKVQDTGTAEERWSSPGHESLQVNSTVFHGDLPDSDAAFAAGTAREVYLLRQLLQQTTRPVGSFHEAADQETREQTRKFGKVELRCLAVTRGKPQTRYPAQPGYEFCTEVAEPTFLRVHSEPGVTMVRNRLATFQNTYVALDVSISYFTQIAVTGHADVLEVLPADAPALPASSSAFLPGIVLGSRKIDGAVPQYPVSARENHISGSVVLSATIDKAGHVKNLVPIFSPDASLTSATMTAVKTWTYTPYLVQGQAIAVETTITVNYNLSGG